FFFSCGRRHTISIRDWSSDVCSSDLKHTSLVQRDAISKPPSRRGFIYHSLLLFHALPQICPVFFLCVNLSASLQRRERLHCFTKIGRASCREGQTRLAEA